MRLERGRTAEAGGSGQHPWPEIGHSFEPADPDGSVDASGRPKRPGEAGGRTAHEQQDERAAACHQDLDDHTDQEEVMLEHASEGCP